jgi:hypothetical protein
MSAAVPHNVVQSSANGGISLILNDERIIRRQITPHAKGCLIGTSLVPGFSGGASDEAAEKEEEALNIEEFFGRRGLALSR